ncbi:MAG: hypothetical protein WA652_13185 [Xanthobacteraceae bacterium]
MDQRIIDQALSISLTGSSHCNDVLGEHLACDSGFVILGKSAVHSPQNTPRDIEGRRQCFGCFGIERCGLQKNVYWHRRTR